MDNEYEKCFVYQCLAHKCKGADIESQKFIRVCLDCPAFRNWIYDEESDRDG